MTRESAYKKALSAVNIGAGGPNLKIDKALVEGVQGCTKKIDASKKIVEEIVGKYFTGYEKLQHGSSSGHYSTAHDPKHGIFDEKALESGEVQRGPTRREPEGPAMRTFMASSPSEDNLHLSSSLAYVPIMFSYI